MTTENNRDIFTDPREGDRFKFDGREFVVRREDNIWLAYSRYDECTGLRTFFDSPKISGIRRVEDSPPPADSQPPLASGPATSGGTVGVSSGGVWRCQCGAEWKEGTGFNRWSANVNGEKGAMWHYHEEGGWNKAIFIPAVPELPKTYRCRDCGHRMTVGTESEKDWVSFVVSGKNYWNHKHKDTLYGIGALVPELPPELKGIRAWESCTDEMGPVLQMTSGIYEWNEDPNEWIPLEVDSDIVAAWVRRKFVIPIPPSELPDFIASHSPLPKVAKPELTKEEYHVAAIPGVVKQSGRLCEFCKLPIKAGLSTEFSEGKFAHNECIAEHNQAILAENSEAFDTRKQFDRKSSEQQRQAATLTPDNDGVSQKPEPSKEAKTGHTIIQENLAAWYRDADQTDVDRLQAAIDKAIDAAEKRGLSKNEHSNNIVIDQLNECVNEKIKLRSQLSESLTRRSETIVMCEQLKSQLAEQVALVKTSANDWASDHDFLCEELKKHGLLFSNDACEDRTMKTGIERLSNKLAESQSVVKTMEESSKTNLNYKINLSNQLAEMAKARDTAITQRDECMAHCESAENRLLAMTKERDSLKYSCTAWEIKHEETKREISELKSQLAHHKLFHHTSDQAVIDLRVDKQNLQFKINQLETKLAAHEKDHAAMEKLRGLNQVWRISKETTDVNLWGWKKANTAFLHEIEPDPSDAILGPNWKPGSVDKYSGVRVYIQDKRAWVFGRSKPNGGTGEYWEKGELYGRGDEVLKHPESDFRESYPNAIALSDPERTAWLDANPLPAEAKPAKVRYVLEELAHGEGEGRDDVFCFGGKFFKFVPLEAK